MITAFLNIVMTEDFIQINWLKIDDVLKRIPDK
jgi:hypothetical protein